MRSNYKFGYADISVYACAVKLITQYATLGSIHIDLGCGYAAIAEKLGQAGIRYIGFDANAETVAELREHGIEAYLINLLLPTSAIETIIVACEKTPITTLSMLDVIEHLDFDCNFLAALRQSLPNVDNVTLIASIPNFSHADVSIKLFSGVWEYTTSGLLDNTHSVIYTEKHLTQIMQSNGWYEVDRHDYRLEYSDQYFIRPTLVLNRHDGIGAHLRQLKKILDKNADIHQFVRAYQATPIMVETQGQVKTLLSVLIPNEFVLGVLCDALSVVENHKFYALLEVVFLDQDLPELFVNGEECLRAISSDIKISSHLNLHGAYWVLLSDTSLPSRDYFNVIMPILTTLTDASVVYFSPELSVESVSEQYLDYNAVTSIVNVPCAALLLPTDYIRQFQHYPADIQDRLVWQNYSLQVALRTGVRCIHASVPLTCQNVVKASDFQTVTYDKLLNNDDFMFLDAKSAIIQEQKQRLDEMQEHVLAMTHSLSWRLTLPLRKAKRVLAICRKWLSMNWLKLDTWRALFRTLVVRVPVLRVIRQKYLHWKFKLLASPKLLGHSTDNLSALQALSQRRFDTNALPLANMGMVERQLPDIDISVVAYNGVRWVKPFVEALLAQYYPLAKIHLWVVDHGSQDDTLQRFDELLLKKPLGFASIELIRQDNLGFGAGHDRAIRSGSAEYCLVTNLDLEFLPDSLFRVVSAALQDSAKAVASWEFRQIPFEHPKYYDPVTLETNWSSHACILMRRSAYVEVGGYDAHIFMYAEDVELSYRFRSYGYVLKYVPRAVVKHFTYDSAGQIKPLQFAGSAIGNIYIRLRYGKVIDRLIGFLLYTALLLKPSPFLGAKSLLVKQGFELIRKLPHFLGGKGAKKAYFPLLGFDYEMIREGAFREISVPLEVDSAPLVSIITRTYKGRETLLTQAVQSIFNQTYPNIELLVVEDGGNGQQALIDTLAAKAPSGCQIHFIACEKLGRSSTGNKALAASTGQFVMFLDDDDLLFADHVETLVMALHENPSLSAAYSLAFEVLTVIDADLVGYQETSLYTPEIFHQEWDYEVLLDHNFIPIQSILFRRELYEARGGFDTELDQLEDWNLWIRYGYGNQFAYIPKTTSLFRSPADFELRSSRHALLHDAYEIAKSKAWASLSKPLDVD